MAHTCPDCGYTCYCGGDIDDLCFDDTPEAMRCTCCVDRDDDTDDDDMFDDDESEAPPQ